MIQVFVELYQEYTDVVIGAGPVLDVSAVRLDSVAALPSIVRGMWDEEEASICSWSEVGYGTGRKHVSPLSLLGAMG